MPTTPQKLPSKFSVGSLLGHSFIPEFISGNGVIIDCGANKGEFAKWLSEHTTSAIHSFEADSRMYTALPTLDRVTFYHMAIDGESGEMELFYGEDMCSSGSYTVGTVKSEKVKKISLDDFCESKNITAIDFMKIDIEGSELPLLLNTSEKILGNVAQITVEFHDFLRQSDLPEIKKVVERLEGLGFYCARFSRGMWSDCLFLNTRILPIGFLDKISMCITGRLIPGLNRRLLNNRLKLKNRIYEV